MSTITADEFRRGQGLLGSACAQVDDGCDAVILTAAQLRQVRRSFLYLARQRDGLRETVAQQDDFIRSVLLEDPEPPPPAAPAVVVVVVLTEAA